MKRFVWKGIDGKWHTADVDSLTLALYRSTSDLADWEIDLLYYVTDHTTWREAFDAAFTMTRKILTNS